MRRLSLDMVDRRRLSEHPVTSNFLEFLIFLFSLGNNKKLANKLAHTAVRVDSESALGRISELKNIQS